MPLRGLSMSARLACPIAGVLVLTTLASPAGALSERERADQIATVAALCELILSGQDPNPDEGRRITEELLAKLEGEVGDPSLVRQELRARSPQCLVVLNRPTVQTNSRMTASGGPTSSGVRVETPSVSTDQPAATTQAQTAGLPEIAPAEPVAPETAPRLPIATTKQALTLPTNPLTPAPAIPLAADAATQPVAAPPLPSATTPPTVAPVLPATPKPTRPAEVKRMELRPAAALTVVNGREVTATTVTVTAEAKTVMRSEPLASQAKAILKLPKLKGCVVTVEATFEGGDASEVGDIDLCKVKLVRLTD
jgi:hypothetical protein